MRQKAKEEGKSKKRVPHRDAENRKEKGRR